MLFIKKFQVLMNIPKQTWPFPAYPWLQVHVNEPIVFSQVAWEWHELVCLHSSMSENNIIQNFTFNLCM